MPFLELTKAMQTQILLSFEMRGLWQVYGFLFADCDVSDWFYVG